ncbi:hypothetical protein CON84_02505 [Bacillus sp. AFS094228]|nr:hypothetical protein CON84_02505 [Bacillus sp. AFS094228]
MKFESKYLIRWGIPGWVLIFWFFYEVIFLKEINPLESNLLQLTKGLTLLFSLAAIGVPLGYLMHQIYFFVFWVLNKTRDFDEIASKIGNNFPKQDGWGKSKKEDYYQLEYVWHSVLINQNEETRKYLEGRYRHLLSTIHSLGSLFVSSALSIIITVTIALTNPIEFPFNYYFWTGLIFQLIIFVSAVVNYKYFSDNLKAFQIKMLKTYL